MDGIKYWQEELKSCTALKKQWKSKVVKTTLFFINLINFYGKLDMNVANSDRFFSGFSIAEPLFSCAKLFNLQTLQLRSAAAVGCILRRWERRNDSTVHCKCLVFTKAKFYFFICGKSHPRLQAWMKYDEIDMMKYENIQNSDHQTAISAGGNVEKLPFRCWKITCVSVMKFHVKNVKKP